MTFCIPLHIFWLVKRRIVFYRKNDFHLRRRRRKEGRVEESLSFGVNAVQ